MSESLPGIPFGTDGWRAIIADGFTFETVRLVSRAIAIAAREVDAPDHVDRSRLVVGFDRRFLSREFAEEVAVELKEAGYCVLLSSGPTPSQTVSHAVVSRGVIGGIVVTASHNPAVYNGIKFKGWYGGSALPSTYAQIASYLGFDQRREGGSIERVELMHPYVEALREQLDVARLSSAGLRILHDPIHGAAAGIPERVLDAGSTTVTTVRGEINPSFGGVNPEPIPDNLEVSMQTMRAGTFDLAICNDGDADRLGILDETGSFVSPHKVISLLALYLVRQKGRKGEIIKTFSTTRLIERIGRALGIAVHETPIGFKYVADLMLAREILIGGEESGGIGFGSFLPERDGVLSGLLVAEAVAAAGKPLSVLIREMEEEFGFSEYDRLDVTAPIEEAERLIRRVLEGDLDEVFEVSLDRRESVDGAKLSFNDDSWILFRKSGTEPLIRIYCEAADRARVDRMLEIAVRELRAPAGT
ncbi:MAG TPA: phosphoglucomutase/phosphomannomutase family protein [Thermoanaerobaculia bacterium]|nr:phosphoglucomutase/phosphomannomutase family protein [Thermoanaerobaculia bacterium]